MELITKRIDLEQYKSRIPANVPPCQPELYCQFLNELDGDWGMVPKTVRVPDELASLITVNTDTVLNIPVDGEDGVYYPCEPDTVAFRRHCNYMHSEFPEDKKYYKYYVISGFKLYEVDLVNNTENEVKYLTFNTLHKWFKFFFFYNETFLGGFGYKEFTSAVERWNWERATNHLYEFKFRTADCQHYDDLYNSRGGKEVMKWLFEDVFGCYRVVLDNYYDYYDLVPHFMFFGQIRQWKVWFNHRYDQYKDIDWIECKDKEDCCDCREWFRRGATDMYNWLMSQKYPDFDENICIDGSINITLLLTRKISDLGFYVPLISDFSTNQKYNIGNEVVYDEHVFRLETTEHDYHGSENGIDYSPEYREKMFGDLNPDSWNSEDYVYDWKPESDWDWKRFEGECMEVNDGKMITGETTSKLIDLRDLIVSTDDMGEELHGYLNIYSSNTQEDSTGNTVFIQPEEGTEMDMIYHKGNIDDLTAEKTGIIDPDDNTVYHDLYWGSIITKMEFYLVNESGERIPVMDGAEENFIGNRFSNLDAIRQCEAEIDMAYGQHIEGYTSYLDNSSLTDKSIARKIYCDIEYVIGGIVDRVYGVNDEGDDYSYYQEIPEDARYNPYNYKVGVRYKEKALIRKKTDFYHTNEGTSILLYYYEPYFGRKRLNVDDQYDTYEHTASFTAYTYCNKDNDYNGVVTLRMIRRDKDLQLSSPYKEDIDIYIDRGSKTAIDKNLKLQEVRSLEALEQYGNGSITISDSE